MQREQSRWADCWRTIEAQQYPTFILSFERLVADPQSSMDAVFEFLGLNPVPVESESVRQNPSPVVEKVSNWNELPLAKASSECRLVFPKRSSGQLSYVTSLDEEA